ncbi:hypothetical protein [Mucilaginibacter sp.]
MNSPTQLKQLIKYIEVSATSRDMFVTEFTLFIGELEKKVIAASDSAREAITDDLGNRQFVA